MSLQCQRQAINSKDTMTHSQAAVPHMTEAITGYQGFTGMTAAASSGQALSCTHDSRLRTSMSHLTPTAAAGHPDDSQGDRTLGVTYDSTKNNKAYGRTDIYRPGYTFAAGQQILTEPATECMTLTGTAQTKAGTGRRITENKTDRRFMG